MVFAPLYATLHVLSATCAGQLHLLRLLDKQQRCGGEGLDPDLDYLPKVLLRKAMAFLHNVTESGDDAPFFMMVGTPRSERA